jgi:hypothetical protein
MNQSISLSDLPKVISSTIRELSDIATSRPIGSIEQQTLDAEAGALRGMLDALGTPPTGDSQQHQSLLVAVSSREHIDVPSDVIERVGNIYRAFGWRSSKPCPHCGAPLRSERANQCFECGADWHGQPT